ncbi:hypothetical protein LUZ61_010201 [Rhynchospora tenuis]|uniref:F-box domain-containing protein n=1 Tax=Rhynchospora tenuis TaxID=198213 RepID=A0AAD6EZ15_9POAL|nr:hypothetical protein LUZ61_010201 [Rhynchospora tenuis]
MARRRSQPRSHLPLPPLTMKRRRSPRKLRKQQVDHLSNLPDALLITILSLLSLKEAACTSVVSSRFRNLWTACPNLEIARWEFPFGRRFVDVTTRCLRLRLRNPEIKLLNFSIHSGGRDRDVPVYSISKWLKYAHSLGVQELTVNVYFDHSCSLLPLIFSLSSIQSLVFRTHAVRTDGMEPILSDIIRLTHLKSLHLRIDMHHLDLTRLLNAQKDLEYLWLGNVNVEKINIELQKLKVLKVLPARTTPTEMNLFLPLLETLELAISLHGVLKCFKGKIPRVRKASIYIPKLQVKSVPLLGQILSCIAIVEELNLYIEKMFIIGDNWNFHPLVEQGKELPTFPNLRKLKVYVLCHEKSIQDVVSLLHHAPVLESLKLVHAGPAGDWNKNAWVQSKLPRDALDDNDQAYFSDLQNNENKNELIKLLTILGSKIG